MSREPKEDGRVDKIKIMHLRDNNKKLFGTVAVLWFGDSRFVGYSECSDKDQFCRKVGRVIAVGRAATRESKGEVGINHSWQFSILETATFRVPTKFGDFELPKPMWLPKPVTADASK